MKVKIIERGYVGYTGNLGRINFENAVSVGEVEPREALMLGGYIRLVEVDDAGNEIGPVSHAAELVRTRAISAKVVEPLKRGDPNAPSPDAAEQNAPKPVEVPNPMPVVEQTPEEAARVWNRDELEAVADSKGIKGLREIGAALGVKNTSIPGLIDDILAAQTQNQKV